MLTLIQIKYESSSFLVQKSDIFSLKNYAPNNVWRYKYVQFIDIKVFNIQSALFFVTVKCSHIEEIFFKMYSFMHMKIEKFAKMFWIKILKDTIIIFKKIIQQVWGKFTVLLLYVFVWSPSEFNEYLLK